MSMFTRQQKTLEVKGMNLRVPVDRIGDDELTYQQNVRSYTRGIIEARPGLGIISAFAGAPVNAVIRLTDDTTGAPQPFTRIAGAGGSLYAGVAPAGPIDSGYSGNPVSMVTFRPDPAVSSFAYVADRQRQSKVDVSGTRTNWGSPGPLAPPTAVLAPPLYNQVATFDAATGDLVNDIITWAPVNAGPIVAQYPINDLIQRIVYDVGATGWCNVVPNSVPSIPFQVAYRAGAQFDFLQADNLTIDEVCVIQEVKQAIPATTIAAIAYDAGVNGPCAIAFANLATATDVVTPTDLVNNLLVLNGIEYVRVISATTGPDNTLSVRTVTAGTYTTGMPVSGIFNFRTYAQHTQVIGRVLQEACAFTVIANAGLGIDTGIPGNFQAGIVQTRPHNLLNIGGRPAQPDDLIHVSIYIKGLANFVEGRIMFDVDATENDFSRNYYFFPFQTPDIQAALQEVYDPSSAPASVTTAIQTAVIDANFNDAAPAIPAPTKSITTALQAQTPTAQQTTYGDGQWAEIVFRVNDLFRLGADASRSLANVAAMQISLTLSGGVTLAVASIWVGGSYGPDVADLGAPYQYRYRAHSSANGARTNPSPPMRSGVTPNRQAVNVTGAQHPDPQMDLLDIERFGGSLTTWQLVGTIPNTPNWTYQDVYDDTDLAASVSTARDAFQPYPTIDTPKTSVVNVAGTTVRWISGDQFNLDWGEGTVVIINGLPTTLYAQPMSVTQFEIVDNLAALANVPMTIQQADLLGQPMASAWVHPDGWVFGCGCPQQPGTVFWTNRYNPDSTQDSYSLDLSDPNDPLIVGCAYDTKTFCFTQKTIFALSSDYTSPQLFSPQTLPIGKGPVAPWCLAVGDVIAFVDETGIYEFDGVNVPVCITNDELGPLFQHDGIPGLAVSGVGAPDFTHPELMQLSWGDGKWWFDYQDTQGNPQSLFYDRRPDFKGWWQDIYTPAVALHYQEIANGVNTLLVGGNDGALYQMATASPIANETDNGATIYCVIRTRCDNAGDTRLNKLFGDGMVDLATNGVPVTCQMGADEFLTQFTPVVVPGTPITTRQQVPLDLNGGDGYTSPTFGVTICFTPGPQIFAWGWSLVPKVETTAMRATDWEDGGTPGNKFVQGVLIRADTMGANKPIEVQYDGGVNAGPTLVVNDTGEQMTPYSINPPVLAHLVRLQPLDGTYWRLLAWNYIYEPSPELVLEYQTQFSTFDSKGFKHAFLAGIAHMSTATITMTINVDGVALTYPITASGGGYTKVFVQLAAVKGKAISMGFASTAPFGLFMKDCEFWIGDWTSASPYRIELPFGGPSRAIGAVI